MNSRSSKIPNAVAPGGLGGGLEAHVDWSSACRCLRLKSEADGFCVVSLS